MDDHHEIVEVVEAALTPAVTVVAAHDGAAAISAVHREPPDLVLLDVKLPDVNGLHVLVEIRAMHLELPVVIMTGHSSEAVAVAAANLAVAGYLRKPFGVAELKRAVSMALAFRLARRILQPPPEGASRDDMMLRAELSLLAAELGPATLLARLSTALGISRRRLRALGPRGWRRLGRPAQMERRLEQAKALLRETREPIKAIAATLGFHDSAHFCRQFRRWLGQTPLAYRRRIGRRRA